MTRRIPAALLLVIATVAAPMALAADHMDGPAATADPAADITDLFAWTSADGARLNLVLDVFPGATSTAKFSNAVQYVFHTTSHAAFGAAGGSSEDIVCTFDTAQKISCWAGNEYLSGDASNPAGLASGDGKLRVFAGLREDPFFFNLHGFKHAVADVKATAAANGLPAPDAAGCYNLGNPGTSGTIASVLVKDLTHDTDGTSAATDTFAGGNVLALALQVDLSIVNHGGPVVGVWASTNK